MSVQGTHIYWLEQSLADVHEGDDWLTPSERFRLDRLHISKRRSDWRLGRWSAKCAVAAFLGWPAEKFREIEVSSESSGAPILMLPDRTIVPEISISHSCGRCICAVAPAGFKVGCDIEHMEPRSQAFIETFFAGHEIAALNRLTSEERTLGANVIWSAKESYLKATREGLRRDLRDLETVSPQDIYLTRAFGLHERWRPLWLRDGSSCCRVLWQTTAGFVETVTGSEIQSLDLLPAPGFRSRSNDLCRAVSSQIF